MYDQLLANLAILVLAGFVGFAVISKVPNTLHTPLMSGTNAIHGIVVLGALIVLGELPADAHLGVRIIAFVALIFGTLNVIGVPPAKKTKMTAMPQLVALFNGVGGGTVALIAWAEFIETDGFAHFRPDQSPTVALVIGSLFAAIIGSVSFWGSLVAFLKLQESIPKYVEKRLVKSAKLFQASNVVLLLASIA